MKRLLLPLIALLATEAHARHRESQVTSREPVHAVSGVPVKRNYKQVLQAIGKTHEAWKKAHLNETLYACQRNPEQVALLARKVADRLGASEKEALKQAKAVEGTVESVVGSEATEIPAELSASQLSSLRAKAQQLGSAQKQAQVLERLAGQVMKFYQSDAPRESAVSGNCEADYKAAMRQAEIASTQYHVDAAALSDKLTKLTTAAQIALRAAEARTLVASAR